MLPLTNIGMPLILYPGKRIRQKKPKQSSIINMSCFNRSQMALKVIVQKTAFILQSGHCKHAWVRSQQHYCRPLDRSVNRKKRLLQGGRQLSKGKCIKDSLSFRIKCPRQKLTNDYCLVWFPPPDSKLSFFNSLAFPIS